VTTTTDTRPPIATSPTADDVLGVDLRHPGLAVGGVLAFGTLAVGLGASRGLGAGVAAIVAVVALVWALHNRVLAALATVAIVPLISGFKRGLPLPGLRLSEIVVVGFSTLALATASRAQWRRWGTIDWLALGYVIGTFGLGLADSLARGDHLSQDDWGQLVGPLQFFLLYRAVFTCLPTARDRARAVDWLLLGSVPISLLTLAQAARVPGINALLVNLTGQDWSGRLSWTILRATGPFPHWTMLAGYLFGLIVLCMAVLLGDREDAHRRRIALIALVPGAIALVLTVTLGPMIGAVVGAVGLALWYGRGVKVVAYTAVVCAALLLAFSGVLTQRADDQFQARSTSAKHYTFVPYTVSKRVSFWTQQYLPTLKGRWLTGYGPQIPPDVQWKFTESIYITMLMRGGLVLLVLYGALMAIWGGLGLKVARAAGTAVDLALARSVVIMVVLLTVIQIIVPYFTTTGLPHLMWIVVGLLASAAYEAKGRSTNSVWLEKSSSSDQPASAAWARAS
jgi:hypothetical protein